MRFTIAQVSGISLKSVDNRHHTPVEIRMHNAAIAVAICKRLEDLKQTIIACNRIPSEYVIDLHNDAIRHRDRLLAAG